MNYGINTVGSMGDVKPFVALGKGLKKRGHRVKITTGAVITGTFLTPLLLPVIPGRAFAWKGWLLGLI